MIENRRIPRSFGTLSWLLLGIAAGSGCAGASRSLLAPEVELVSLSLLGATRETQRFALTLLISNPNVEPVIAQDVRYSVRVAGEGYLDGSSGAPLVLDASGRQTLRVEIETDTVSSASRLVAVAQALGSIWALRCASSSRQDPRAIRWSRDAPYLPGHLRVMQEPISLHVL
jgi:hypothetical protein